MTIKNVHMKLDQYGYPEQAVIYPTKMTGTKFARRCHATGMGMDEGYLTEDGMTFKLKRDVVKYLADKGIPENEMLPNFDEFGDEAWETVWTDWDVDNDAEWIVDSDGKLIPYEQD